MKRWNDIQVTSLLTERAPGMIILSNQGLCSLNVRSGTNVDAVPEKGRNGIAELIDIHRGTNVDAVLWREES